MLSYMDTLNIRKRLRQYSNEDWSIPERKGEAQWFYKSNFGGLIIVSDAEWPTPGSDKDISWIHASISRSTMPTYDDLKLVHRAVFPKGWSYQIFPPEDRHINIHKTTLHLFGREDNQPQHPDFQKISGINSI